MTDEDVKKWHKAWPSKPGIWWEERPDDNHRIYIFFEKDLKALEGIPCMRYAYIGPCPPPPEES